MNNHNINLEIDRDLEKSFFIDRTERDIIIGEEAEFDTITPEQMLTWAIDTNNIPLRSRDGAIIRVEGGGNTYWGPDFIVDNLYSQIFWVIDNGNGTVSVTELVNYDKISEGFNSVTTGITEHLSAPKYQVNFKTSGAGATYVSFGMITTIAPTSTTTVVTMDTIYSGMIGQTLIVQNLKSSGNVTITLGANTLLDSVSNVLTPGQTLHLVAMGNAVSLTDYQFAKNKLMENNRVKILIENNDAAGFLEKQYIIPSSAFADEEIPEDLEVGTWAINLANIPLQDRDGAVICYDRPSLDPPGNGITFEYVWWLLDDGAGGISLVRIEQPVTADPNNYLNGYFKITLKDQVGDTGSTPLMLGEGITVLDPATTTGVTITPEALGVGKMFLVQNFKTTGDITFTLGSNTLLNGSNVVNPEKSVMFMASQTIGVNLYAFSIISKIPQDVWTTATRPGTPDLGQDGFNTTDSVREYWDGTNWIQY